MHVTRSTVLTLALSLTICTRAGAAPDEQIAATIRRVVEQHSQQGETGSASRLSALVRLGTPAVPTIVGIFAGSDATEKVPPLLLDRRAEALIFEAMRAWPPEQVSRQLVRALGPEPEIGERLVIVRLLGEVGTSRSLRTLIEVVEPVGPIHLGRPYLRTHITAAIRTILERDPLAFQELQDQLGRASEQLVPAIVEALGQAGGGGSVDVLASLLEDTDFEELRVDVLRALGGLDVRGRAVEGERVAEIMAENLRNGDPAVRRQAIDTLRRIHDTSHVTELIDALEDSDPGVSAAALSAVRQTTGLGWPARSERWRTWHKGQLAILASESDALDKGLTSEDPARASKALRQLAGVRVQRSRVGARMAAALDHENEDVVLSAIRVMAALDEPSVLPRLIDCLYDPRIKVRTATLRELRRMTGHDAGTEPKAWLEWMY